MLGPSGRHLLAIRDINQAALSADGDGAALSTRVPDVTFINEIQSIGTSNYNSFQATIRASNLPWIHGTGRLHLVA
jgi:hypothetical protein